MQQTTSKNFLFMISTLKNQRLNALKNIDLLSELSIYEELNVIKTNYAFRGDAMSYKVQLVEKKMFQLNSQKQVNQVLKTFLVIFQIKRKVLSTK